ncbi:YdcF family protein [Corynebacterium nuruki]|uniref:YdcF family protein n=1 Tax=Corynebacterium nuruki TaxID=1032851 RepID=UPI0026579A59|nr:YdcF family protein [Corynebacterium nuruki]
MPHSPRHATHRSSRSASRRTVAAGAAFAVVAGTLLSVGTAAANPEDKSIISANRTIADIPVVSKAASHAVLARDATVPVVVLGARLNDDCSAPQVLDDRLDAAADLARAHLLNPVIVTGGETQPDCPTEAQAMDAGLRARGVPNQVIEENKAGSTVENVANTADTINSRGGLAVVVTSTPHNVRALQNFRDAGIEAVAYTGGEG